MRFLFHISSLADRAFTPEACSLGSLKNGNAKLSSARTQTRALRLTLDQAQTKQEHIKPLSFPELADEPLR